MITFIRYGLKWSFLDLVTARKNSSTSCERICNLYMILQNDKDMKFGIIRDKGVYNVECVKGCQKKVFIFKNI